MIDAFGVERPDLVGKANPPKNKRRIAAVAAIPVAGTAGSLGGMVAGDKLATKAGLGTLGRLGSSTAGALTGAGIGAGTVGYGAVRSVRRATKGKS